MPQPAPARQKTELPAVVGSDLGFAQRVASGGDVLAVEITPSGRLLLMLLDICGVNTESISAPLVELFRSRSAEAFIPNGNDSISLSLLVLELNREILRVTTGTRCTAGFIGCFDPQLGTLWYVNAGHTPALAHDGEITQLAATGVPLGLFSHAVHDAAVHVLAPGARLALVSKGVIEHEDFGVEQAATLIRECAEADAARLSEMLLEASDQAAKPQRLWRRAPQDKTAVALIRG